MSTGYSGPRCDILGPKLPDCNSDIGINLAGIVDWSTEWPFIDIFKSSRDWISQNFISYVWNTNTIQSLSSNGYPTSLLPNQKLGSMLLRDLRVCKYIYTYTYCLYLYLLYIYLLLLYIFIFIIIYIYI